LGMMRVVRRIRSVLRDGVLSAPSPFYALQFPAGNGVALGVERVRHEGALDAGCLISGEACSIIHLEMTKAFAGLRPEIKLSVNQQTGVAQVNNPLRLCPELLSLALDPFLLAVIEQYFHRQFFLADIDMRRVPAMDMEELDRKSGTKQIGYTSSHWHRDVRGRQIKVMAYLTDVKEADNNFAYLPGTHKGQHIRPAQIEESRLSEAEMSDIGITPVECYGPAGTTLLFDTNVVHRLRRKSTASTRDSVTFYYTTGQELRRLDFDPAPLSKRPAAERALLDGTRN